ncbi:hypothetical protein GCM10010964_27550 [Caldovatus sediminis]|uniref:Uncharacterized protein n=1 Tax=Caldovatus sediminis TaxID=2041189 RepID=A0A8J2ZCX2_9PROT|nr:hypothetical protein [Caldovatus sediminis]GGG38335.1 hypothetical protein GCM10010964_27550 [Caldovatus sediminis]
MDRIATASGPRSPAGAPWPATDPGRRWKLAERSVAPQWQAAETAMLLAHEMTGFMTRRLRAQVALFETLSRCTDFNAALRARLDFLNEASAGRADKLGHLARVAQHRLAAPGATPGAA